MKATKLADNFKGIFICEDEPFIYNTLINKRGKVGRFVARIPIDNSYTPLYMGSIGFDERDKNVWQMGHYYPLSGFPKERYPLFLGKGLPTLIEREIIVDLNNLFNGNLQVRVIANESFREAQLKRIGVNSGDTFTVKDYLNLLDKCIEKNSIASEIYRRIERK
ncbi:MAG: hypothetical protein WCI72_01535 [archaeon]